MIPTHNNLHWNRHWSPNIDYSFKHSFSWPQATIDAAKLTESTTAATESAASTFTHASHGAGGIPPRGHGMYYHMYGRGGYPYIPRRRFGGRLFWFGAGVGVAALYYRHKQQHRQWDKAIASGDINQDKMNGWAWKCENSRSQVYASPPSSTSSTSTPSSPMLPTSPTSATLTTPSHYTSPTWQSTRFDQPNTTNVTSTSPPTQNSPSTESAILAAIQHSSAPVEVTQIPEKNVEHRWGWGERRRRRQEAKQALVEEKQRQEEAATQAAKVSEVQEQGKEEMKRLREVMESMWNDRKVVATTAQAQANEKAREYARKKLERLSIALDNLRESLEDNHEKEKKLV